MKVVLVAAMSLNGKITRGDDPDVSKWTSSEDFEHFTRLKADHNLLVMGRRTYEAMRPKLSLSPEKLRVVLTRHPENFTDESINSQLEFSDESPASLVHRLKKSGYSEMLLLGGSQLHSLFFSAGLVDEIYLTIEPLLFGNGTNFAAESELNINLELLSTKQLNSRGTLLLHYKILKDPV